MHKNELYYINGLGKYLLIGSRRKENSYSSIGIDLEKLYYGIKSYLIEVDDEVLNYTDYIEQDQTVLFDETINKYFAEIIEKQNEILDRAKMYGLEKEYEYMINQVIEQYDCL